MLHGIPDELRQFLADELAAEEAAAAEEYRRLMERAAEEAKKPVYLSLATDWHRVRATVIEDESSDEEEAFLSLLVDQIRDEFETIENVEDNWLGI